MIQRSADFDPAHEDTVLWSSFKNGNRRAFEKLLKNYYSVLFRYASRFSKNRALVEDCLQDVFVYIWEHRSGLGNPASVRFYLLKSVRNRMFLELKGAAIALQAADQTENFFEKDIEEHLIEEETEQYHKHKLSRLISGLPDRQKEALYLKYFEGLKVEEIGEVMSVSRQSAANFLYRALSSLRGSWIEKTIMICLWCFAA